MAPRNTDHELEDKQITSDVPWTCMFSSNRQMLRKACRSSIANSSPPPFGQSMIDTSDSIVSGLSQAANHPIRYAAQDSINGKISSLSSFCSSYPMTTFISSNKQMNRKLTRDILKNEDESAKKQ